MLRSDAVGCQHNGGYDQLFESVVDRKAWAKTIFVLFMSNVGSFREKLAGTPLGDYFPDYDGSTKDEAGEYLIQRFSQMNVGREASTRTWSIRMEGKT